MQALLFDLDDTILDYTGSADRCWSEACAACCDGTGTDAKQLVQGIAEARRWFWDDPKRHRQGRLNMLRAWETVVSHAIETLGLDPAQLPSAIARDFSARRRAMMQLFPDALECLERFRQSGIVLALVTNGDAGEQRFKIERHDLARFFDAIVIEGELGVGKPDEAVYRHALATIGARPETAWMVGDNLEWDVDGPQRLGLRGVWLDRARRGLPTGSLVQPHRVIRTLHQLTLTP